MESNGHIFLCLWYWYYAMEILELNQLCNIEITYTYYLRTLLAEEIFYKTQFLVMYFVFWTLSAVLFNYCLSQCETKF